MQSIPCFPTAIIHCNKSLKFSPIQQDIENIILSNYLHQFIHQLNSPKKKNPTTNYPFQRWDSNPLDPHTTWKPQVLISASSFWCNETFPDEMCFYFLPMRGWKKKIIFYLLGLNWLCPLKKNSQKLYLPQQLWTANDGKQFCPGTHFHFFGVCEKWDSQA